MFRLEHKVFRVAASSDFPQILIRRPSEVPVVAVGNCELYWFIANTAMINSNDFVMFGISKPRTIIENRIKSIRKMY